MNSLDERLTEYFTIGKLTDITQEEMHAKRKAPRHYVPSDRVYLKQNPPLQKREA